jgi:hypothetical protein
VEEASSESFERWDSGEGAENVRDEDLSREDWEYSWITEGMTGAGNRREGQKASRTALHENQSGPRALIVSLPPPHSPRPRGPSGIQLIPPYQPELPEACGQW